MLVLEPVPKAPETSVTCWRVNNKLLSRFYVTINLNCGKIINIFLICKCFLKFKLYSYTDMVTFSLIIQMDGLTTVEDLKKLLAVIPSITDR